MVDSDRYPPLLSCLEVLPPTFPVGDATLLSKLSGDGSLFRSPSATAAAFMATRNSQMLPYLHHLVQNFNGGGDLLSLLIHLLIPISRLFSFSRTV